ncbi:MAG: hypothetical protein NTZ73_03890 [Candidatus Diapherotrites archaeon]|nr:hypothetical protein [Candidatus Diapherotrites archaeon]
MGKSIYVIALLCAIAIIFSVAVSIFMFETVAKSEISQRINNVYFVGQLDRLYNEFYKLDENLENKCKLLTKNIDLINIQLYDIGKVLPSYKQSFIFDDYETLKRNYVVGNMLVFAKVQQAIIDCNYSMKPIIYFYPFENCSIECDPFVNVLEEVKNRCKDVRIFALPFRMEKYSFTEMVEAKYNVQSSPSLIINGVVHYKLPSTNAIVEELGCT